MLHRRYDLPSARANFFVNAKVAMLGRDKTYVYGEASEAMNSENLQKIYNTDVRVVKNVIDGEEYYSCVAVLK